MLLLAEGVVVEDLLLVCSGLELEATMRSLSESQAGAPDAVLGWIAAGGFQTAGISAMVAAGAWSEVLWVEFAYTIVSGCMVGTCCFRTVWGDAKRSPLILLRACFGVVGTALGRPGTVLGASPSESEPAPICFAFLCADFRLSRLLTDGGVKATLSLLLLRLIADEEEAVDGITFCAKGASDALVFFKADGFPLSSGKRV